MRDDSECGADTITYINCWALPETQTPTIDWKSCNSGITAVIEQQVNTTSALTSETSATIKEAGTYTARVTITTCQSLPSLVNAAYPTTYGFIRFTWLFQTV